jgi:hypothetical protein
VTDTVATVAAVLLSYLEHQRSIKPSSLLVVYFSCLTITYLPRLRSLYLSAAGNLCRNFWTAIYSLTVLAGLLESWGKAGSLRPPYNPSAPEETVGFWGRTLFIWLLSTLRRGYSGILELQDIPPVDPQLGCHQARARLREAWDKCNARYRLMKAFFIAYTGYILACIPPRLILSAFTFCQPFLISATINLLEEKSSPATKLSSKALVGAFVLVYLGMAVSSSRTLSSQYHRNS